MTSCTDPSSPGTRPSLWRHRAWSNVAEYRAPSTRSWTPEVVLGCPRSTSFAGADLFGARHAAFEDEARALLDELAAGGSLVEEAVFTVLLARRPGGAR
jgi:hypothetical protein